MKWLRELFKSKREQNLEHILSSRYGGIYKRIDENRELMQLLQTKAPEFLAAHPWVKGWLESTDGFLSDLENAAPALDAQFKPKHGENFSFPRNKSVKHTN